MSKLPFIRVKLPTAYIDREVWDVLRAKGLTREDIIATLVDAGNEQLKAHCDQELEFLESRLDRIKRGIK